jgi:hypothetical protein
MGMKSSKAQQGAVSPIQITFDGGLNYADSPTQIQDNEMVRALNLVYNSQTGIPETRKGTECVTATALAHPIVKLFNYEKSSSEKWLVCASYGKLYYLDDDAWVEIGSLASTSAIPSFLTFNTSLLIADGGANLKKWDGTTLSSLSDGLSANAIAEVGGRVVINSTSDRDLVTFSGVEDETMWDTADLTNPAIGIRAGFGDNMVVNAFAVFGTDLIVSKIGQSIKKLYRINTAGVPTEWTVATLSENNAAQNARSMINAFNNVYFVDDNGYKSLQGVTAYGDLQVDFAGYKINSVITGTESLELSWVPEQNAIWLLTSDRIYAYHLLRSGKYAFTDIYFQQGTINSIVQKGSIVYLAGQNGYLYALVASNTDEVSPSVTQGFPTIVVSKRFMFFGGGILRKTSVAMKALATVIGDECFLRATTTEREGTLLKSITILSSDTFLVDATGDLYDATIELAALSGVSWLETTTNRVRGSSIQWQIDSTEGRFGIEGLTAEVALVTG